MFCKRVWNVYKSRVKPTISSWCKTVGKIRNRKPSQVDAKPFVLRGLLTCKKCGCLLSPEIKKGKFVYYSCTNAKGICKRVYIPEKELMQPILGLFEAFKAIPASVQERLVNELRKVSENEVSFHVKEVSRIRAEYDRVGRRLGTLLDMRLDGSITSQEYDKKVQELKDQQYQLNIELDEYTKADHQYHIHVSTVLDLSRRMGEIYESSEVAEKRAILQYLLQNSVVDGRTVELEVKKPFNVVLELAKEAIPANEEMASSVGIMSWLRRQDSNLRPID